VPGVVHVFCARDANGHRKRLESVGVIVETFPGDDGRVDLAAVCRRLGDLEINEVLVEAGPLLNGALLAAGLIDELIVYQAGHVIGDDGRGMFATPALTQMSDRVEFSLSDLRRVGDDCRMIYARKD
jgi:diaminohydroxyphosphoribosylaminopyrimidine deaminase/5-amino-6-(5-phosphoribosylamino)uracil reductase